MKPIRDALVRLVLFACVFIAWMWVLAQPFSPSVNLAVIVGCVLLVFPIVWFARLVLDRDPTPGHAEWITTLVHAVVMVCSVPRSSGRSPPINWRGWVIPIPGEVGLLLVIVFGAAAALAVMNLAVRGLGAPFGIALSRRLAIDWLYAWSRNPMVLATLALLVRRRYLVPVRPARAVGLPAGYPGAALLCEGLRGEGIGDPLRSGYLDYKAAHPHALPAQPSVPRRTLTRGRGASPPRRTTARRTRPASEHRSMKILALEKERPGAAGATSRRTSRPRLGGLGMIQTGAIRETHYREDRSEAIIILEAESPTQPGQPCRNCRWSAG